MINSRRLANQLRLLSRLLRLRRRLRVLSRARLILLTLQRILLHVWFHVMWPMLIKSKEKMIFGRNSYEKRI